MRAAPRRRFSVVASLAIAIGVTPFLVSDARGDEKTRSVVLSPRVTVMLLAGDEAREAIVEDEHDPFFKTLSTMDLSLRLARPVDEKEREAAERLLRKVFKDAVTTWSGKEVADLLAACRVVLNNAEQRAPSFVPARWRFVVTDGTEEARAAYTRHDAIILPKQKLGATGPALERLVAHETAHVFSRANPALRDRLYARLGFRKVGPISLGPLAGRRITNPDAPIVEHVIRVQAPGKGEVDAALVTYSREPAFDPRRGRTLFDYLRVRLFAVDVAATPPCLDTRGGVPEGWEPSAVGGFFEQVGRNTRYIIHPEEILADNLALLMMSPGPGRAVADERLLTDLAEIIRLSPPAKKNAAPVPRISPD